MRLGVRDRIILFNILPDKGNFATYRTVEGLKQKLSFSPEEINNCKIVFSDTQCSWENNVDIDVEFNKEEVNLIVSCFKRLDDAGELVFSTHAPLYSVFREMSGGSES